MMIDSTLSSPNARAGHALLEPPEQFLAPAADRALRPRERAAPSRALDAVSTAHGADAAWDAFVRREPGSTFCHLSGWRHVMQDILGHENRSLVSMDGDGVIRGILPLVRVRSRLLGHYLISMPFLNDGGPLGAPDVTDALVREAVADAARSGADLLELRTRSTADHRLRISHRKIAVQMPLAATREENWTALHSKVRSQVKRAQREGFEVRFGLEQREAFYELFAKGMRRLGTPVLPASFFERIAATFPTLAEFCVIRLGDEPIAVGCGFQWRDRFEITWAAASREHSKLAPNMLLYWEFFERARARGARVFDFGRCTPGTGSHAFKRQWGGVDVPLPWAQWSASEIDSTPKQDKGMFKLASTAWSHLPLGVTNRIGPWLAAKLP
jgi:FemAB-related protein (PEP-CTERM system-associated)